MHALNGITLPENDHLTYSSLLGGLPRGKLIEISGDENVANAAKFLSEHRNLTAAWIYDGDLPKEALDHKINLNKVLFIKGDEDASWCASTLLKSQLFPVIIYQAEYKDEKTLRRFRLQAKQANTSFIILRKDPAFSWTIALQLRSKVDGLLDVLRRRPSA